MSIRQDLEAKLAASWLNAPQNAETVYWYPANVPANQVAITNAFVDRGREEGTNESFGDGATPDSPHGRRFRITYLLDIPASYAIKPGDTFKIELEGWVMSFIRWVGRDSARQTLRIVYVYPINSRAPIMRPTAASRFNKSM